MIITYVDESGTHQDSKVLTVAAYVGEQSEWDSAEVRFRRADKYAGIPFHAVDCATGGRRYKGVDKDKRNRITRKIIKIINDHDIYGIAWGAWIDDFAEVIPRDDKNWEKWLSPLFALAFSGLLIEAAKHVEKKYPGNKFSVVLEHSKHWYVPAAKRFLRMKNDERWPPHRLLDSVSHATKRTVQLYAPDTLAYEAYLMKTRERYPTGHRPREQMASLLQKLPVGGISRGKMLDRKAFGHFSQPDIGTDTHLAKWHRQFS
jgi:hypothetical protein